MKRLMPLVLICGLGGCGFIEKLPPVEVCVMYKGRHVCMSKGPNGWRFSVDLTAEEKNELIAGVDK